MPSYEFRDTITGEIFEKFLKFSELDDYKDSNPHIQRYFGTAPTLIGGIDNSSGGKLPDGFKDKLKEMKKKHPGAQGMDHLI